MTREKELREKTNLLRFC